VEEFMMAGKRSMCIAMVAALILGAALAKGQSSLIGGAGRVAAKRAAVEYLYPEQVTVPAGRPSTVVLHFRIAPGLHINSHTPRENELIPTTFSIPEGAGVRLEGAVYPPGTEFQQSQDARTKLSVYAGEFAVQARLVAMAGSHLVEAKLRYQACDHNACMPPRTITAAINVVGK
jgi:hypothetical protein